jgi:NCS1 family nucleobase:cation symporter-1
MVLAGFAPKYINIKRGAVLLGALGLAVNPWQLTATASTFIGVISGFGIFIAPMTGIMLCDYLVIRRRRLSIPDLYIGDSSSIYWYWRGYHWRAVVSFLLGCLPLFPGFIMNLLGNHTDSGWVKLFQITFLVGLSIGFVSFLIICLISPPPHYKEGENFLVSLIGILSL